MMRKTFVVIGASVGLILAGGLYLVSCESSGSSSSGAKAAAADDDSASRDQMFAEPGQYAQRLIQTG